MTRKLGTWKRWGKQPNQAMRHQFDQDVCSHCGYREGMLLYKYGVGFSNELEFCKPEYENNKIVRYLAVGVLVRECPQCFEHCYSHVYKISCTVIERQVNKYPPFLIVPGAYEAFMQMLKEVGND
ncbi:hypothetical protein HQ571_04160 [Candidatus Kuenenbacteria bacterium]|nr:hypothetical protein [Candidatus Kuenenbacteria bacterium]